MIPGYVPHDRLVSSSASKCSTTCKLFTALELETIPSRRSCLIIRPRYGAYFSQPNFHTRSPSAPNYKVFLVTWCSCNKQTSLQNNQSEKTVVGEMSMLGHLSNNTAKGCQNGTKLTPSKAGFRHPIS